MWKWFDDLRIGTKMLVVLATVLAFTTMVGGLAVFELDHVSRQVRVVAGDALPRVRLLGALRATVLELRATQYAHMVADAEDDQKRLKAHIAELTGTLAATSAPPSTPSRASGAATCRATTRCSRCRATSASRRWRATTASSSMP